MSFRTIESIAVAVFLLAVALAFHAWLVSHDEQQKLQSTLATQKRVIDDANSRELSRDAALKTSLAEIDKLKQTAQSSQELVDQLQKYLRLPEPIQLANRGLSPSPLNTAGTIAVRERSKVSTAESKRTASMKGKSPGSSAVPSRPPDANRTDGNGLPFESPGIQLFSSSVPIQRQPNPGTTSPSTTGVASDSASLQKPQFSGPGSSCDDPSRCIAEVPAEDLKPLFNYVQDCRACDAELAVAHQNASDDAAKIASLTRERDAAITASKGGSFFRRLRRNLIWLSVGAAVGYAASR